MASWKKSKRTQDNVNYLKENFTKQTDQIKINLPY